MSRSPLDAHVFAIERAVKAQRQLYELIADVTPGLWQWVSGRVESGRAPICYVGEMDGKFIAACKALVPLVLVDVARMRRIEAAARELMGFLDDGVAPTSEDEEALIAIAASTDEAAEAFCSRLNELRSALGEADVE